MAKSEYYFPLLYRRLLVSTTGWKDEEFGAYLRLLIHQFDNNNRISPDLEDLKRICPSIKRNWPLISKKFKADENGMLYNDVMNEVFNEATKKKTENKINGFLGGRPKKENQTVIENKPNGLYETNRRIEKETTTNGYENKKIFSETNAETQTNIENELVTETKQKPNGNENKSHPITITKAITKEENTVVDNPVLIEQTASPQQQGLLFQMFKNCSNWKTELILQEIGKFKNKYPELPLNKSGPVVNSWVANYKPIESQEEKPRKVWNFSQNGMPGKK